MSLRWRKNGKILCAAKHKEKATDTYIDDRLHGRLVEVKAIVPDENESLSGVWYWTYDVFIKAEV